MKPPAPLRYALLAALLLPAQLLPAVAADAPAAAPVPAAATDLNTPVSATKAFFAALKAHDAAGVERGLGAKMKEKLTRRKMVVAQFITELEAEIGSVVSIADEPLGIKGDRAKVPVTFNDPKKGLTVESIDLINEGGVWRIESF